MVSAEAREICAKSLIVDLHVDPILQYLLFDYDLREAHDMHWRPGKRRWLFNVTQAVARLKKLHRPFYNHIDIPRMVAGGYGLAAFGVHYYPVQSEAGWRNALRQLDYLATVAGEDERIELVSKPAQVAQVRQAGKVGVFAGVEGVHCLGAGGHATEQRRLDRLQLLFERYHVRYVTLAHFSRNDAATPCLGLGSDPNKGLTNFGRDVVRKMNEIGLLVDVAHVSNRGVLDACQISAQPVMVTHAGLQAVRDHQRNISDAALRSVAETGGIVGIIFAANFLAASKKPDSGAILDHIDHVVRVAGEDHVALGSDFDGWIPGLPMDLADATDMPQLVQRMLDRGYTLQRIEKILGQNFLRVWRQVLP